MGLGKDRMPLFVALLSSVVLAVLLSPLGFETRPPAELTPVGYVSIAAVVAGVLLDLVAIVLILRSARSAAVVAIAGSAVLLIPNLTDRAGLFFATPAPPVITALEYAFLAVLLVTVLLALSARRASAPDGAPT